MKKMLITVVAVALLATLFYAAPASAHVTVTGRNPGKGDTASTGINRAWVKFNQNIRSGTLRVYKVSNGNKVSKGTGRRDPRNLKRIICQMKDGLTAGQYRARFTVIGPDGHQQSGSWRFRLA
jgi:methionine-rich copper-binding protein CopC